MVEGVRGGGELLFDGVQHAAPISETAGVAGRHQLVGFLLGEVAAGEAMLKDQQSGDEIYIRLDDHKFNNPPYVAHMVIESLTMRCDRHHRRTKKSAVRGFSVTKRAEWRHGSWQPEATLESADRKTLSLRLIKAMS